MADPWASATSIPAGDPPAGEPTRPGGGELALLLLLAALGLALRLAGAAELPWAAEEVPGDYGRFIEASGGSLLSARALALAIGVATAPAAFALLRSRGRAPAFALALLVATSPWHVHASRIAGATTIAFLLLLIMSAWLSWRGRGGGRRLLPIVVGFAAVVLAGAALLPRFGATAAVAPASVATLLTGDVGLAVPLLALIAFFRRGRRAELVAAVVTGWALLALATRTGIPIDPLAAWLPPLLIAAADELGRLLAATGSWRARLAYAIVAVVPTLPSLLSEQIDGGRFDLARIARSFERERRGGEPLFASDPALAARALGVEALPLERFVSEPPPADRDAYLLLLLARGEVRGGAGLPPDLESRLDLVERSGARRFDASRFEARLYRRRATP